MRIQARRRVVVDDVALQAGVEAVCEGGPKLDLAGIAFSESEP